MNRHKNFTEISYPMNIEEIHQKPLWQSKNTQKANNYCKKNTDEIFNNNECIYSKLFGNGIPNRI